MGGGSGENGQSDLLQVPGGPQEQKKNNLALVYRKTSYISLSTLEVVLYTKVQPGTAQVPNKVVTECVIYKYLLCMSITDLVGGNNHMAHLLVQFPWNNRYTSKCSRSSHWAVLKSVLW